MTKSNEICYLDIMKNQLTMYTSFINIQAVNGFVSSDPEFIDRVYTYHRSYNGMINYLIHFVGGDTKCDKIVLANNIYKYFETSVSVLNNGSGYVTNNEDARNLLNNFLKTIMITQGKVKNIDNRILGYILNFCIMIKICAFANSPITNDVAEVAEKMMPYIKIFDYTASDVYDTNHKLLEVTRKIIADYEEFNRLTIELINQKNEI